MNRKIVFFFIFINFYFNSFSQNIIEIKGRVYNQDTLPILNATILVRNSVGNIISYTFTHQDGTFKINFLENNYELYTLQVSHINYITYNYFYKTRIDSLNKHLNFYLENKINILKDVIINSKIGNSLRLKDTLEFSASNYITKDVIIIEDLLKKINGFNINSQGNILFNGKEIDRILIDGEDLTNKNYTILSKNLAIKFIDKIQIINNFNDNAILKKFDNSNKVAINLTISEKKKNYLSGNTQIGFSYNKRKEFNNNLFNLSKKNKLLFFFNQNNIGNKPDLDIPYYFNKDEGTIIPESYEKKSSDLVKIGSRNIQNIGDRYINNNDDSGIFLINSYNHRSNLKSRILIGKSSFFNEKIVTTSSKFLLPNDISWSNTTTENFNLNQKNNVFQYILKNDNLKNNALYSCTINQMYDENINSNILRIIKPDTIVENLSKKYYNLKLKIVETFKIREYTALIFENTYSKENFDIYLKVQGNKFNNYLKYDSTINNLFQKIISKNSDNVTSLKLYTKIRNTNLQYVISNYFVNTKFNNIISQNIFDYKNNNNFNFHQNNVSLNFLMDTKLSNKFSINIGSTINQAYQNIFSENENKSANKILYNTIINYKYNISETKIFSAQFNTFSKFANRENYYSKFVISGNSLIFESLDTLILQKNSEFTLSFTNFDIYKNNLFKILFTYNKFDNELSSSNFYTKEYSIFSFFPTKNNNRIFLNSKFEQFIKKININLILDLNYSNHKYSEILNNINNSINSNNLKLQIKLNSVFKLPVNFETSNGILYSKIYSNINSFSNIQYESFQKIKVKISKNISSNLLFSYYKFNLNSELNNLDLYITYKINGKSSFSVLGHNLFNNSILNQKFISNYSQTIMNYSLVNKYIQFKYFINF